MPKRLFLIDAYALIFRYYYAFLGRPMRNRNGLNTSVVFGFTKFLRDILRRESPDLIGVAFDPPGGSFRRDLYSDYKANRPPTPEDIILSVPYVKRLLEAMCIPILEVPGYEADDVIGTLARRGVEAGYSVYMVTPDKDYCQLVGDNCVIYRQKGEAVEIIDSAYIEAKYGFSEPHLVSDMLALWGDASDNIPGVPGIGEKGAAKLVREWGDVQNILANSDKIGGKTGKNIAEWGEKLLLSKRLAEICRDVPIDFVESELTMCSPNYALLKELYTELNFTSFLRDLEGKREELQMPQTQLQEVARSKAEAKRAASLEGQGDLFALFEAPVAQPVPTQQEAESHDAVVVEEPMEGELKSLGNVEHRYDIVQDSDTLSAVVATMTKATMVSFKIITATPNPIDSPIVGIAFATEPYRGWYVPLWDNSVIETLRPLFESTEVVKVGHNIKFDLMTLRRYGVELRGEFRDVELLHYILDSESRHTVAFLAERYLYYRSIDIETLVGRGAKQLTLDLVAKERVAEYSTEYVDLILRLGERLYKEVETLGMRELYHRIEEPMIEVLAEMEMEGVTIDSEVLREYGEQLREHLARLENEVRTMADEPQLNINSSRQLGDVLFGKLCITEKPKMTKTKQFSTEEEYLQGFAHDFPIVSKILEYRGVKKLLSTYVDALPDLVNRTTGRIHTSYNQAVTATGRLSSTNPNLQNIPIRDELGRPIRSAFVASDSDHILVAADYSQIELRLMAHLSKDETLVEAFTKGEDIHSATAARLYHKSPEEVTTDERRRAKTANFGIIYGISAFGLAQRLDIPNREAKALIENYFISYPGVKRYMDEAVAMATSKGYVETLFGRRRQLRDITSSNRTVRGIAERNAINAPIQGSAADIMKLAMVEIARRFKSENIASKMIMQVHDEVVIDTLRSELDKVERIVKEAMESVANFSVKLIAEVNSGENWLEAH